MYFLRLFTSFLCKLDPGNPGLFGVPSLKNYDFLILGPLRLSTSVFYFGSV